MTSLIWILLSVLKVPTSLHLNGLYKIWSMVYKIKPLKVVLSATEESQSPTGREPLCVVMSLQPYCLHLVENPHSLLVSYITRLIHSSFIDQRESKVLSLFWSYVVPVTCTFYRSSTFNPTVFESLPFYLFFSPLS